MEAGPGAGLWMEAVRGVGLGLLLVGSGVEGGRGVVTGGEPSTFIV
jgi:hypothetical protein